MSEDSSGRDLEERVLERILKEMELDLWYIKLKRWVNFQFWLLYCLLFNNRVCRYFKYKKINKKSE